LKNLDSRFRDNDDKRIHSGFLDTLSKNPSENLIDKTESEN